MTVDGAILLQIVMVTFFSVTGGKEMGEAMVYPYPQDPLPIYLVPEVDDQST